MTTVLLIDEGQKLPLFALEILRELLNYETNDQKLLQIVIFAQKEFNYTLSQLKHLNDRINFRFSLSPLGFAETKGLIDFRLDKSCSTEDKPSVFRYPGYIAIYHYTRGYPRKIIHLCHHILLSLIIQEKQKAGFFFVRICATRVFSPDRRKQIGFLPVAFSVCLLIIALFFLNYPNVTRYFSDMKSTTNIKEHLPKNYAPQKDNSVNFESNDTVFIKRNLDIKKVSDPALPNPSPETEKRLLPKLMLGNLKVPKDANLYKMIEYIYGSYKHKYLKTVLDFNSGINNSRYLKIGMLVDFPIIRDSAKEWTKDNYFIILSEHNTLQNAYASSRQFHKSGMGTKIVLQHRKTDSDRYMVTINNFFTTCDMAYSYIAQYKLKIKPVCVSVATFVNHPELILRKAD